MSGSNAETVFLMYHELRVPGRPLCDDDPGYVRYVVEETAFRAQMDVLVERGYRGLGASEWLDGEGGDSPCVVLTFDDGPETDLIAATPILLEHGFSATSYVTVGFVGQRGFLSESQTRELVAAGIEVGCHSMSHAFLPDLDDAGLMREIVDAKDRLEQICGARVRSFSCPGGRFDDRVLPVALAAGYDSVTTSRLQRNSRAARSSLLGRFAVLDDTDMKRFGQMVSGEISASRQLRDSVLTAAKSVLGNDIYVKLRSRLLG